MAGLEDMRESMQEDILSILEAFSGVPDEAKNGICQVIVDHINTELERPADKAVKIRWGSDWRSVYMDQDKKYHEYKFKTIDEVNAFILGVDECDGWLDYTEVEDE